MLLVLEVADSPSAVKLVAKIISGVGAMLRSRGLRKNGRLFYQPFDRGLRLLSFQRSQWSSATDARFTVNLGVYYPGLRELAKDAPQLPLPIWPPDRSTPPSLEELGRPPGTRIGDAMPARTDHWWTVSPDSDVRAIQSDVEQTIVEYALPWLERYSDLNWLAKHRRGFHLRAAAECYVLLGDLATARECLQGWIAELESRHAAEQVSPNESMRVIENVRAWARAVGLDL